MQLMDEYKAIDDDRARLRNEIIKHGESVVYLPVNLARMIAKAKQQFDIKPINKSDLHPHDVMLNFWIRNLICIILFLFDEIFFFLFSKIFI